MPYLTIRKVSKKISKEMKEQRARTKKGGDSVPPRSKDNHKLNIMSVVRSSSGH